jgi:hypothetical protein
MAPVSHAYVTTKLTKRQSYLLIFGSMLPDITSNSKGVINRHKIHYSPNKLFRFVKTKYPDLIDLAIGVKLHSYVGKGADFYSDDERYGFAVNEGKKLNSQAAELLGLKQGEKSYILAHNFIEAGVDLNLADSHPHLLKLIEKSYQNCDLLRIAEFLSLYLKIDKKITLNELKNFIIRFDPKKIKHPIQRVDIITVPLIKERYGIDVDKRKALELLEKAKQMMKKSYIKYLDDAVENMKKDFPEYLKN